MHPDTHKNAFKQQSAAADGAVKARKVPHGTSAACADSERGKRGLSRRGQPFCCT